jgi:hypothetical protein
MNAIAIHPQQLRRKDDDEVYTAIALRQNPNLGTEFFAAKSDSEFRWYRSTQFIYPDTVWLASNYE